MSVTSYVGHEGKTLWRASACVRSKQYPSVRVQKAKFNLESQQDAEREERKLLRECEREVLLKEAQGSSWGALVEEFERHLSSPQGQALNEITKREYIATTRKHTASWWKRSAAEINRADLRELFSRMTSDGFSTSHQKKMKVVINRIFTFGIDYRLVRGIDRSPAHGLQLAREEETVPEILTLAEIRKLLASARAMEHPWYYHWALALLTGMRSGELYALLWTDIDWENQAITVSKSFQSQTKAIKCTKAGYWRTVPISSELNTLLLEIRAQAGSRPSVLPRHWVWTQGLQAGELRKFCRGMGLPSIRFHTLRACFATQLIRSGVPPIQIQKICGWRDLKTMQRYIRLAGIEIQGATESLRLIPELEVSARVVNLFTRESVQAPQDPR